MKRLLKVTSTTSLLTLFKMSMGFIIAKVIAVYAGPSGMALLGQVQSMVGSFNGIINAPVGSGIVRYTAEYKDIGFDACRPWWRASIQWIMIISAIIIPLGLLLSDHIAMWLFHDITLSWVIIVTVCFLPFSAMGTLCNSVINGQQLYRRYVALGMLSVFFSGSSMLIMVMIYNIRGALLAATIQSALIGIVMLVFNLRQPWFKISYWWGKTNTKSRKDIGSYMLMALASALAIPLSLILVRSILVDNVGWNAAGQWQAVWKISEVYLSVITLSLSTYYLPKLSRLNGYYEIKNEINKTLIVILPIVIALAFGIYFFREVIISILFTGEFKDAEKLFAIQLLGDVIKIISWLYAYPMISRGAAKWFISTEIIFSSLFVLLCFFTVQHIGLQGANIAYLINYLLYFIFVFLNLKRFSK